MNTNENANIQNLEALLESLLKEFCFEPKDVGKVEGNFYSVDEILEKLVEKSKELKNSYFDLRFARLTLKKVLNKLGYDNSHPNKPANRKFPIKGHFTDFKETNNEFKVYFIKANMERPEAPFSHSEIKPENGVEVGKLFKILQGKGNLDRSIVLPGLMGEFIDRAFELHDKGLLNIDEETNRLYLRDIGREYEIFN